MRKGRLGKLFLKEGMAYSGMGKWVSRGLLGKGWLGKVKERNLWTGSAKGRRGIGEGGVKEGKGSRMKIGVRGSLIQKGIKRNKKRDREERQRKMKGKESKEKNRVRKGKEKE